MNNLAKFPFYPVSIILLSILLSACGGNKSDFIMKGRYVYGHEVDSFSPCDTPQKSYWPSGPAFEELHKKYEAILDSHEPYQSVYVEFHGRFSRKADPIKDGELPAESDGLVEVVNILKISKTAPENCKGPVSD